MKENQKLSGGDKKSVRQKSAQAIIEPIKTRDKLADIAGVSHDTLSNDTELKEILDCLYLHEKQLTVGQMDFINSCKKQFTRTKQLSDKQFSVLKDIRQFLSPAETRVSMNIN